MGVKVHVVFDDQDLIDQCVYIHLYFFLYFDLLLFAASGPLGFGSNSRVSFVQKESYRRDQIINQSNARKRRAIDTSSVMIRYRTTAPQEPLLIVSTRTNQGLLWVCISQ